MYPSQIAKERGGTDLGYWNLEYEPWQYYELNVIRMPDGFYTTTVTELVSSCATKEES